MTDTTATPAPAAATAEAGGISGAVLRSYIERIEKLEEEKAGIAADIRELTAAIHAIHPDGRPVYGSPHIAADPRWARLMAAVQAAREIPATEAIEWHAVNYYQTHHIDPHDTDPAKSPIAGTPEYWWIEEYPDDEFSPLELHEALDWHKDEIPEGEVVRAYGCREVIVKTVYVVKTATGWIEADTYQEAQEMVAAAALTIEGQAE